MDLLESDDEGVTVPDPTVVEIPTEVGQCETVEKVEVTVPDTPSRNPINHTAHIIAALAGLVVFAIWVVVFVDLVALMHSLT
jgi:hypothetical protein